jgi:hypothetical protein
VLGDYYFATPWFGNFRASGGLMVGATGGAPLLSASAGSQLGLSVQATGLDAASAAAEVGTTLPYVGVGFSSALWHDALSLSADLGWTASPGAQGTAAGRALLGTQGRDMAWREWRLSPVVQLGFSYRF